MLTLAQVARELSRADSLPARAEAGQEIVRDAATMLVAHEQLGFYPCEQLLAGTKYGADFTFTHVHTSCEMVRMPWSSAAEARCVTEIKEDICLPLHGNEAFVALNAALPPVLARSAHIMDPTRASLMLDLFDCFEWYPGDAPRSSRTCKAALCSQPAQLCLHKCANGAQVLW